MCLRVDCAPKTSDRGQRVDRSYGASMPSPPYQDHATTGTIAVHFENGTTLILPASTECWDPLGPAPVRALFQLPPHDREPWTSTLGDEQRESSQVGVCIRAQPGFRGCGFESVKVESKDERIARLEVSLARQTAIAETLAAAVQKAERSTSDMMPLRKPVPVAMIYDGQKAKPLDPVQPYQPRWTEPERP